MGRGQGARRSHRVRAPRVARRLLAVTGDHGDRDGSAHEACAHCGRGCVAPALQPDATGRGDDRARPPEPRSRVVHLRHRLPARRVRAVRDPLRGPGPARRREARRGARRVEVRIGSERERTTRHAATVHTGWSEDLVGRGVEGRGAPGWSQRARLLRVGHGSWAGGRVRHRGQGGGDEPGPAWSRCRRPR